MRRDHDYFDWLATGDRIRVSARAIIFSPERDQILIERNDGLQNGYANFIGGGVEVGETLQACIERELSEETNAEIAGVTYLFVLENFIRRGGEIMHSLEHYFQVDLDRKNVTPRHKNVVFIWTPIAELHGIDLRPAAVRDSIMAGRYRSIRHLV